MHFLHLPTRGCSCPSCTNNANYRRVWHPCHTHAALQIPSTEPIPSLFAQVFPQNSQNSQKFLAEDILPRISQNTQKLLAEKSLPRISQMYTDFSSPPEVSVCSVNSFHRTHSKFACASPPTEFTEYTEASGGGYSPTEFTEFTEASGGEEPPTDFTDVHRFFFSASRFCIFREFCGKIVLWLRGYGRDAIPSYENSHRLHSKFAEECDAVA